MVNQLHPTRAEINDITSAVTQGIDGIVLLSETSIGSYYKESVNMLSQICKEAEAQYLNIADKRYIEH